MSSAMEDTSNIDYMHSISAGFWDELMMMPQTLGQKASEVSGSMTPPVVNNMFVHDGFEEDDDEDEDTVMMILTSPSEPLDIESPGQEMKIDESHKVQIEESRLSFEEDDQWKFLVEYSHAVGRGDIEYPDSESGNILEECRDFVSTRNTNSETRNEIQDGKFHVTGDQITSILPQEGQLQAHGILNPLPSSVYIYDPRSPVNQSEEVLTEGDTLDRFHLMSANKRVDLPFWKSIFREERLSMEAGVSNGKIDDAASVLVSANTSLRRLTPEYPTSDLCRSSFSGLVDTQEVDINDTAPEKISVPAIPPMEICPPTEDNVYLRLSNADYSDPMMFGPSLEATISTPLPVVIRTSEETNSYFTPPANLCTPLKMPLPIPNPAYAGFIDTALRASVRTQNPTLSRQSSQNSNNIAILASGPYEIERQKYWAFVWAVEKIERDTGKAREEIIDALRRCWGVEGRERRKWEFAREFGNTLSQDFGEWRPVEEWIELGFDVA